jgi:hypothetical protein
MSNYQISNSQTYVIDAESLDAALKEVRKVIKAITRTSHAGAEPTFISLVADYSLDDGKAPQLMLTIEDA